MDSHGHSASSSRGVSLPTAGDLAAGQEGEPRSTPPFICHDFTSEGNCAILFLMRGPGPKLLAK
jgi:hypothetical protein